MRQDVRDRLAPEGAPSRLPTNIYETPGGDAYVLEIAVPGLESSEIVLEADADSVVVRTEPRQGDGDGRKYVQREQAAGPMSRVFEFPVEIDTDNIQATLETGILKVCVPKAAAGRRKVIRITPPGRPGRDEGGAR
jgi:HSP20 family protein